MTSTHPSDLPARIALLESLAFTAVEHEASLDLLSLVAYVDLYARHLERADEGRVALGFEAFVLDADALEAAARASERMSGVPTRSPGRLGAGTVPGRPRGTSRASALGEVSAG